MPSGSGTTKKTQAKTAKFATLDSLRKLTDLRTEIDIDGFGRFEIRQVSVKEFLDMQDEASGDDGEIDEWMATKLLLTAAVVNPPLADDEDLLGALPLTLTRLLTEAVAEFSGTSEDFGEGSPTG